MRHVCLKCAVLCCEINYYLLGIQSRKYTHLAWFLLCVWPISSFLGGFEVFVAALSQLRLTRQSLLTRYLIDYSNPEFGMPVVKQILFLVHVYLQDICFQKWVLLYG